MASCSDKNNDDDPTPTPPVPEKVKVPKDSLKAGVAVNPANMTMAALSGFVYDADGKALRNVKVTSGSEEFITGVDGGFVLESVNNVDGRSVVTFTCDGYFDVVRSMPVVEGDVWEVTMAPTYSGDNFAYVYSPVYSSINLTASNAMTVNLQAYGYKYADSDEPVNSSSYISAQMLYLSPDSSNFSTMMPGGDLAAIDKDEDEVQLISWGMVYVNLTDEYGRKVQPADGKPATLTFPVPEKFSGETPPDQIPLWSFDEQKGLWIEEGMATYDSDKNVYVGTVTHFSWANLDYPEKRGTLKVNVKDVDGNVIPNQIVDLDGQRSYTTDVNGNIECFVPINTDFYVTVRSRDYSNYSPEVKVDVERITIAGGERTVNITLPTLVHISGKVVNSGEGNCLGSLWIEYGKNETTKPVHTDADGQFILNAPFDYTGAAKLVLMASDGSIMKFDITLDGTDHAYTVSIKTDKVTGGIIRFTPTEGKTMNIVVNPMFAIDFNGVELTDNNMYVNAGGMSLTINDYSENKSVYTDVPAFIGLTGGNNVNRVASVTVTKTEFDTYKFQLSGNAQSQIWAGGQSTYSTIGTLDGEFTAPLFGEGKNCDVVTSRQSFFPSFTPWIDGKAASCFRIIDSPVLGRGVLLWFNSNSIGVADYKNLKSLVQNALGAPIESNDSEIIESNDPMINKDGWGSCYFYKDGKFIMLSYCGWRNEDDNSEIGFWALRDGMGEFARIQLHVLEGVVVSPELLMNGHHH